MRALVLALFLAGCSPYPMLGYYESDERVITSTSEAEREWFRARVEYFEETYEKAEQLRDLFALCEQPGNSCLLSCNWGAGPVIRDPFDYDKHFKNVDTAVNWYKSVRPPTCGGIDRTAFY